MDMKEAMAKMIQENPDDILFAGAKHMIQKAEAREAAKEKAMKHLKDKEARGEELTSIEIAEAYGFGFKDIS